MQLHCGCFVGDKAVCLKAIGDGECSSFPPGTGGARPPNAFWCIFSSKFPHFAVVNCSLLAIEIEIIIPFWRGQSYWPPINANLGLASSTILLSVHKTSIYNDDHNAGCPFLNIGQWQFFRVCQCGGVSKFCLHGGASCACAHCVIWPC